MQINDSHKLMFNKGFNNRLDWLEKMFFPFCVLLSAIPLLIFDFYPTMDGAAHLYNSKILKDIALNSDSVYTDFYLLNQEPVPNWIGHFVLVLLQFVFSPAVSEKILLIGYFFGMAFTFRAITEKQPNGFLISYFILPFIYSFVFILGFYNFSIALVFLLFLILQWSKDRNKTYCTRICAWVFFKYLALLSLLYFSHLFVFAIALIYIAVDLVSDEWLSGNFSYRNFRKVKIRRALTITSAFIFPSIMLATYFTNRPETPDKIYLSDSELMSWLFNLRCIIGYNPIVEGPYAQGIFAILVAMFSLSVYLKFKNIFEASSFTAAKKVDAFKKSIRHTDNYMVMIGVLLILYLSLPDSDQSAGFVSVRICLLMFIFLLIWLIFQSLPKWLLLPLVAISLFLNFSLIKYYTGVTSSLNKISASCIAASEYMEDGDIVVPFQFSDHWLTGHFSNYLGIHKKVIVMENYEASTGYFPVLWNPQMPSVIIGKSCTSLSLNNAWIDFGNTEVRVANFVFILGSIEMASDENFAVLKSNLQNFYTLVFKDEHCELYKLILP